jgi:hypothetical protein
MTDWSAEDFAATGNTEEIEIASGRSDGSVHRW